MRLKQRRGSSLFPDPLASQNTKHKTGEKKESTSSNEVFHRLKARNRLAAADRGPVRLRYSTNGGQSAFASSILVGVSSILPPASLTVPVTVIFLEALQTFLWNSLLTSLWTR